MKKIIFIFLSLFLISCSTQKNEVKNETQENGAPKPLKVGLMEDENYGKIIGLQAQKDLTINNISANNSECILVVQKTPWESEDRYFLAQKSSKLQNELEQLNKELEESQLYIVKNSAEKKLKKDEVLTIFPSDFGCKAIKELSVKTDLGEQNFS